MIPLAGLITALVGMVFGIPSLRLKGLYLAVATLAAHFIIEFAVSHWESVTGGRQRHQHPAAAGSARWCWPTTGSSTTWRCR